MSTTIESHEIQEIRAFFEERNRTLLLSEHAGSWEAIFPIKDYPSFPPYATGPSEVAAARNALALWHERPDLGGTLIYDR